jgi:acyl dehydratase
MAGSNFDIADLRARVGQEWGVSDWLTVTQEMIDTFADVTGDRQWIHTDVERARTESPYGVTIAHGFFTLALLTRMYYSVAEFQGDFSRGINYGLNRVRFPSPVPVGARIRGRYSLAAIDEIDGGLQLTWNVIVEVEGSAKPALVAEWLGRVYR